MTQWTFWPENDELRAVRFTPAFHRCTDPKGNYGIGDVHMMWMLRVDDWAMAWDVSTDWGLPDAEFRAAAPTCKHPMHRTFPSRGGSGGAVDWHSPVPQYEGHEKRSDSCELTGGPCYVDTGFLLGDELFRLLRIEGDDAVWARLRELLDTARREAPALSR